MQRSDSKSEVIQLKDGEIAANTGHASADAGQTMERDGTNSTTLRLLLDRHFVFGTESSQGRSEILQKKSFGFDVNPRLAGRIDLNDAGIRRGDLTIGSLGLRLHRERYPTPAGYIPVGWNYVVGGITCGSDGYVERRDVPADLANVASLQKPQIPTLPLHSADKLIGDRKPRETLDLQIATLSGRAIDDDATRTRLLGGQLEALSVNGHRAWQVVGSGTQIDFHGSLMPAALVLGQNVLASEKGRTTDRIWSMELGRANIGWGAELGEHVGHLTLNASPTTRIGSRDQLQSQFGASAVWDRIGWDKSPISLGVDGSTIVSTNADANGVSMITGFARVSNAAAAR